MFQKKFGHEINLIGPKMLSPIKIGGQKEF